MSSALIIIVLQLTRSEISDIKIAPYSMLIPSESYFADSMQHNSAHYIWANRTYQPSQPPPGHLNQHFPQLQPYSPGVFLGHNGHADRSAHSYSQDLPAASPYILLAPVSAERQSPSPSHPMPHSLPFYFAPTHWYNQPLITSSPPYMVDHHAYHIPEAAPIFFPHHASISSQASSMVQDPVYPQQESEPVDSDNGYLVCVLNSRRRPQCWDWDHGCNGREFSSFSNLLRHQRERSGAVTKAECSICGAVFTRKTARNTHIIEGRCPGVGVQMGGQLTMAG
ncbi:uncharacterized protein N7479_008461 [Penicillium vulpinum]|uniref:C2H2-type domain-containing protein n=1 Tax=Penicillium vulpinum TaxID=29845 RepID=A0A1V6RM62_9EURO|nr:uncharacterized protein N7479_008461 [Penicillium vulpinum]KAJ5961311.1 hypothetical protein N7479_008461 [Penicillium vulpinum]OQE02865.1 hypothetical protein PENVUL_c037G00331 [Penicillium vulpinum]